MSNPLMGMMGGMPGGNGPFGMIQRMMGMMQNTQNPGAMLQNMAQSNPNIKKATTIGNLKQRKYTNSTHTR